MLEIGFTKKVFANLLYFSPRGQKRCAETETFEVPGSCCPMSGNYPTIRKPLGFCFYAQHDKIELAYVFASSLETRKAGRMSWQKTGQHETTALLPLLFF